MHMHFSLYIFTLTSVSPGLPLSQTHTHTSCKKGKTFLLVLELIGVGGGWSLLLDQHWQSPPAWLDILCHWRCLLMGTFASVATEDEDGFKNLFLVGRMHW